MPSVTYGKTNYGKCEYGKCNYGKSIMANETAQWASVPEEQLGADQ